MMNLLVLALVVPANAFARVVRRSVTRMSVIVLSLSSIVYVASHRLNTPTNIAQVCYRFILNSLDCGVLCEFKNATKCRKMDDLGCGRAVEASWDWCVHCGMPQEVTKEEIDEAEAEEPLDEQVDEQQVKEEPVVNASQKRALAPPPPKVSFGFRGDSWHIYNHAFR